LEDTRIENNDTYFIIAFVLLFLGGDRGGKNGLSSILYTSGIYPT